MRLTFKRFVVAGIIGLQVVTVTAVLLSSQLSTQDVILGYARQIMGGLADDTAERSRRFMAPAQAAVELTARLAESGVVGFDDIDALERYLFEQLRMRPQIAGLYYGRTDGEFLYVKRDAERDPDGVRTKYISHRSGERMVHLWWRDPDFVRAGDAADPADTFDPRERPWYRAAVARGGPVWTDPYIFFTSRQPGVTAASPIYTKAGSLAGVIGVDVEIGAIGEFLNGLALGRNGSAFILSADGEVLAVPGVSMPPRPEGTGDKLRFTRVEELEDPVAKAAAATLWALPPGRSGQAVAAATPRIELDAPRFTTFSYQARDWHAVFAPFGDARWPWIIGIYMPEDDFLVELKRNQLHNVYLAAVIGALACIAGLLFAGSLGRTMAQLRERALAIGHGRLDGDMGIASPYREVQEMTTAFAGMVTALRDHRRQNALLATVMEQAPDATALTDPQLRVSYVNPAFEAATGRRAPACYGRTVFELARPVEPDALPVEDIRAEIAAGRSWHGEFVGRRIDDRSWSIAVGVTPVQDDDGTVTHCLVVLRDISDQKRAEAALVGARDAAILANRAKSDFLANVSHELRTPLNAVIGFSEVLKNELFGPLGDARYREYAGYIYDGGTDLLSLLNDVLDMARVETGRIELMEERFDLERAIRRCGVMVQERARSKNLDLRFGEGLSGVAIQGDERLFRQIVMNLLTNAVKFTPAGGRIRVDAAWPAEGGLLLTVADTGIGIPADALSKVMEPFMRVETALSQDYEGVGLGLPLSRAFAELHGGSLTLESQVGQGTRVTLRLPPERVLRGAA